MSGKNKREIEMQSEFFSQPQPLQVCVAAGHTDRGKPIDFTEVLIFSAAVVFFLVCIAFVPQCVKLRRDTEVEEQLLAWRGEIV